VIGHLIPWKLGSREDGIYIFSVAQRAVLSCVILVVDGYGNGGVGI